MKIQEIILRAMSGELTWLQAPDILRMSPRWLPPWLALKPDDKQMLIAVIDDATSRVLYAQLEAVESTETIMNALKNVVETHGIPMVLYSDRAKWAAYTPPGGGKVDKSKPTQVGRALNELGVEHILAYSRQARGRSERVNRTFQDRLVNELRVAGIRTTAAANRYLRDRFITQHNENFARPRASICRAATCTAASAIATARATRSAMVDSARRHRPHSSKRHLESANDTAQP
jgi:hypothetical protein